MLKKTLIAGSVADQAFVLATIHDLHEVDPQLNPPEALVADAYWLKTSPLHGSERIFVTAADDRGVLYGVFALFEKIARGESIAALDEVQRPFAPIRWVNQWTTSTAASSAVTAVPRFFFADGKVRSDLTRAGQYARILASIGLNGCTINNVNAPPDVLDGITPDELSGLSDFYDTPTGQSYIAKQPEVQQQLMQVLMPRMQGMQSQIQQMTSEFRAQQAAKAAAAAPAAPAPAAAPAAPAP